MIFSSEAYAEVEMTLPAVSGDREVTLKFYGEEIEAAVESFTFA